MVFSLDLPKHWMFDWPTKNQKEPLINSEQAVALLRESGKHFWLRSCSLSPVLIKLISLFNKENSAWKVTLATVELCALSFCFLKCLLFISKTFETHGILWALMGSVINHTQSQHQQLWSLSFYLQKNCVPLHCQLHGGSQSITGCDFV